MTRRALIFFIIVLAILGLADAAYLAETALTGGQLACDINGLSGCNVVAQSPYAHLFGVPLGVYGVMFYAVFLAVALVTRKGAGMADRLLAGLSVIGALASVWFLYIQFFLIKALCIYCLASAAIALLACLAAILLATRFKEPVSVPASSA